MPDIPDFIGKFRVERLLGRGAMGVVYKALDPDIERTVAIKLVRTDLLDGDDRAHYISRFRNEARMVGRCIHPNIVGIHDFSMHEGSPFLVLEFVDGKDLGRTYRRGTQIDLPATGKIALEALKALAYAHEFGVIHRDIKPANILITATAIKVTDFGISRALASDATMSSVLVGTPCYMSPEQCLGGAIDARSDLFSMGSVLYEMLSGARCFDAPNFVATTHKILHDKPEPLGALRPDLPASIVRVIETALAKRPEDRFANAAEMGQALRSALREDDALAAPDDADATVITATAGQDPPVRHATAELEALQSASLTTIERRLAHYLGPMAGYHLRQAMREARTPEELGQKLADTVPDERVREQVRADLLQIIASDSGLVMLRYGMAGAAASGTGLPPVTIDAVTKALTIIMGPIAPHLLRRALLTAATPAELEAVCAGMIEIPEERDRFRKLLAELLRLKN